MDDRLLVDGRKLERFVERLFLSAGLESPKASAVAHSLVKADMMGRQTHGVALTPWYLSALSSGEMSGAGSQTVVSDRGACFAWNGNRLPGAWLISEAVELCIDRVANYGTVTASVANSFHTGALAVYLSAIADQGYMAILSCSSPGAHWVAPFGGTTPLFATNPIASAIPTNDTPVLLDVSCSITTVNRAKQLAALGSCFPAEWALDSEGKPTDSPVDVLEKGGSLLPTGGVDHGHKGFAFALLADALTHGLSGLGRVTPPSGRPDQSATNIFLQVIDPDAFGGKESFRQEMSWLANACRSNKPRAEDNPVRIPGERALALLEKSLVDGVHIPRNIMQPLIDSAKKLAVEVPRDVQF